MSVADELMLVPYHVGVGHDTVGDAGLSECGVDKATLESRHKGRMALIVHVKEAAQGMVLAAHAVDEVGGELPGGMCIDTFFLTEGTGLEE